VVGVFSGLGSEG